MPAFAGAELPITDQVWSELLCLPLYSRMREDELDQVERALERAAP